MQRWSPRGHILKSLASKVKPLALASRPQVLENWPVFSSRTAVFFELLKFCGALEKFFGKRFLVEIAWKIFVKTFFFWDRLKNFCEDLFFWERLRLCPRSLALASSIPVLGLESVCPRKGCPWPWPWPRFFLCPWPWPRALCPRLHLWLHEILTLELLVELWIRVVFQKLVNCIQYNYSADTSVPWMKATVLWPSPQTLKMKHDKAKRSSSKRMYVITA